MREIIVKYEGQCKKCGNVLEVGAPAMYEKTTGIFCKGCEPTDPEEIRAYRQERAERKAARYEQWAAKREQRANAQLNSMPEVRHDWAFITQPGHIPLRARMNAADDRAHESLQVAGRFREKAENLRHVRVKGDAARYDAALREKLDSVLTKGSRVYDHTFGPGEIIGIFKKSYRVKYDRGFTHARDKIFLRPLTE